jgi:hypothetical protein
MTNERLSTDSPSGAPRTPRRKRRIVLRLVLALILIAIVWVLTSGRPFAQGMQELLACKHDQTVIDKPFSVGAHTFRYYKFSLPQASANVAIVGRFTVTGAKGESGAADGGIEASVLEDPAFAEWQSGNAASPLYASGRITQGMIEQTLPAGAGTFYLVFSNRFAQTPKSIQASILLRYPGWMPSVLRRAGSRFWGWFGL